MACYNVTKSTLLKEGENMPQANFTAGIMKYTDIKPLFAGMSQCKSNHAYGPAIRHHCIIHYCVSGKGIFRNSLGTYEITPGQAFIINPDEVTFYKADEENPWFYCWIAFSGSICEKLRSKGGVFDVVNKEIFDEIQELVNKNVCFPEKYLICLIKLFEEIIPASPDSMPGYALRAKDYINLHYMDDLSVEQIAESFNIDRRYLLRLFKKEFGITIVNYIIRTRLDAAYDRLREGYPVNKTAVMCGYSDAYNFSKMFKKYHNISPSDVPKKPTGESTDEQASWLSGIQGDDDYFLS